MSVTSGEMMFNLVYQTASGSSDVIAEVEELKAELQRKERDLGMYELVRNVV